MSDVIRFETASGSVYEVDEAPKRIRRLCGTREPRPRQGVDGEWKAYADLSRVELGSPVVIVWPKGTPLLESSPSYAEPASITSPVVRSAVVHLKDSIEDQ